VLANIDSITVSMWRSQTTRKPTWVGMENWKTARHRRPADHRAGGRRGRVRAQAGGAQHGVGRRHPCPVEGRVRVDPQVRTPARMTRPMAGRSYAVAGRTRSSHSSGIRPGESCPSISPADEALELRRAQRGLQEPAAAAHQPGGGAVSGFYVAARVAGGVAEIGPGALRLPQAVDSHRSRWIRSLSRSRMSDRAMSSQGRKETKRKAFAGRDPRPSAPGDPDLLEPPWPLRTSKTTSCSW
jgi:hypothetical protein